MGIIGAILLGFIAAAIIGISNENRNTVIHKKNKDKGEEKKSDE